jgi:hypothetical protein
MDEKARLAAYAKTNRKPIDGYHAPDGTVFPFSLWNARFVCTPRQRRRAWKKTFSQEANAPVPF